MDLDFNIDSQEKFDFENGHVMPLSEFIECCQSGSFIDYDGFASEILLNDNIIHDDILYPSDALDYKYTLLQLQEQIGKELKIVWYNR